MTILLSIKPEYAEAILEGTKILEFRRRLPASPIKKIIIYSTKPVGKVVGEAVVKGAFALPFNMLQNCQEGSGISLNKLKKYFKGCKICYAYNLGEVKKYEKPKKLQDLGMSRAPQSFVYIRNYNTSSEGSLNE
jgi:predicted transcriptional regulator